MIVLLQKGLENPNEEVSYLCLQWQPGSAFEIIFSVLENYSWNLVTLSNQNTFPFIR